MRFDEYITSTYCYVFIKNYNIKVSSSSSELGRVPGIQQALPLSTAATLSRCNRKLCTGIPSYINESFD